MAVTTSSFPRLVAIAAALSLTACGGAPEEEAAGGEEAAEASGEMPAIIEERQANFEEMGDVFKPIGDTMKTDAPDVALIQTNAAIIAANLEKVPDHFPEGTGQADGFDSDALPAIWETPEDFAEKTQAAIEAGAAFAEAANGGDLESIGAAMGALGGTCKDCHDNYRADDE